MTRHERMLEEALLREVRGLTLRQAVRRLFDLGLVDRCGCERRAIRDEVLRLQSGGMARCEAFEAAAATCCCSYEKARNAFYETFKHRKP